MIAGCALESAFIEKKQQQQQQQRMMMEMIDKLIGF